ncbi:hypothetical protein AMS68_006064 [Peltaster fructicola]|uniref:Amino acid permease/ SLC12A domain-containing protein n=1 Tax=Peltaster fructicola TaxID=286661 RepID=A0A6H0Y0L6_9PEZI|nr:hypothetical protein AMS68_006064 [Peltaster fructicola]
MLEELEMEQRPSGNEQSVDSSSEQLGPVAETNVGRGKIEVRRDLRDYHIIFITISGVLGAGLYTGSGSMLKTAGPGATVTAFALNGALAVMVMQCIGEMICIWPIPNALFRFVGAFVDEELGQIVGLAYWFAWAVSFQALITAASQEGAFFFDQPTNVDVGQIFLLYILPQFVLLALNYLPVKIYGWLEVIGGSLKVLLVAIVIIFMIVLNINFAGQPGPGASYFSDPSQTFVAHPGLADSGVAFLMALSTCTYSFIGVEIPAILATESILKVGTGRRSDSPANAALKTSVAFLPALTAIVYFIAGLLVALDVPSYDSALPGLSWLSGRDLAASITTGVTGDSLKNNTQASPFIIAAVNGGRTTNTVWLGKMFTAFFAFTAWSAANTALYVASRVLYGLASPYADRPGQRAHQGRSTKDRLFGWLAHTNDSTKTPFTAALVSFVLFFWMPYLSKWLNDPTRANLVLSTLQTMASVFVVIVWTFSCLAFINFRHYAKKFQSEIEEQRDFQYLLRSRTVDGSEYPWVSRGQPWVAYLAILGCLLILVAGGSPIWNRSIWEDKHAAAAAALIGGYGPIVLLVLLWMIMKWRKTGLKVRAWWPNELKHWYTGFLLALEGLHQDREWAISSFEEYQKERARKESAQLAIREKKRQQESG